MMPKAPPLIAVTSVLRLPSTRFFNSQLTSVASHGAGELTLEDFNLSIDYAPGDWTSFVYKTSPKAVRKVLRLFVYGEIVAIENRFSESVSGTICPSTIPTQRITLQRPAPSTEFATTVFQNDIVTLSNVIAIEQRPGHQAIDKWVFIADRERPADGLIFLECGPSTQITAGPLHIGARALFDVTLHRVDSYPAGSSTVHKAYSLLAHTAEPVPNVFLQHTGWILPDLTAMPVDESIALVETQMERVRV